MTSFKLKWLSPRKLHCKVLVRCCSEDVDVSEDLWRLSTSFRQSGCGDRGPMPGPRPGHSGDTWRAGGGSGEINRCWIFCNTSVNNSWIWMFTECVHVQLNDASRVSDQCQLDMIQWGGRSPGHKCTQFNVHGWAWNKCVVSLQPHMWGAGRVGEVQWLFSKLVKHRYNTSVAELDRSLCLAPPAPAPPTRTPELHCEKQNIDKSELIAAVSRHWSPAPSIGQRYECNLEGKHPDLAWFLSLLWCRKLFSRKRQKKNVHPTSKLQYIRN